MAYKCFQVPTRGCEETEQALNSFLANHRVLSVCREFVNIGENSHWCFCVDYLEGGITSSKIKSSRRSTIDYRELLSPGEFALFAKLRDLRKEIGQSEGVPVYTIFTNAQLAQIVQSRATSNAELQTIEGLGDARMEKYGSRVAEIVKEHWGKPDEEDRKTV